MSNVKQAGKRARTDPNALQPPLRLSQTPVERWFAKDDERTALDDCLSRMEILKYFGDGVLPDAKYPKFWQLERHPGLKALPLHSREFSYPYAYTCLGFSECRYYPRFVAAAFTTIFIREDEDEGEEFALGFRLGGREYKFTHAALVTAWGLKDEGDTFKGWNYPLRSWNEFSKATAMRELHLEYAAPGKYAVSRMSNDHRLLLYVLSYVLLPRKSNHGTATEEDLLILWAIVNEKQIHRPYLMAHRMLRYSQGKIRRNLVDQADAGKDVGEEAAGDMPMPDTQPQPTVGTSSQVPTETEVPSQEQSEAFEFVRKGFGDMRMMMYEGFTRLSERIGGLDTHMTNQDVDIRSLWDEFRRF
ncbi:hypothetical protein PIB30_084471 [Stylosanthes scabra]|uniref:Uncharacterized protein n=1 Tax=Stylosanthes scabra TaxID=79078 RepID=A0ABU6YRK9_9FABA|nr:hypothetical protein [Stylosanthes scabra]